MAVLDHLSQSVFDNFDKLLRYSLVLRFVLVRPKFFLINMKKDINFFFHMLNYNFNMRNLQNTGPMMPFYIFRRKEVVQEWISKGFSAVWSDIENEVVEPITSGLEQTIRVVQKIKNLLLCSYGKHFRNWYCISFLFRTLEYIKKHMQKN